MKCVITRDKDGNMCFWNAREIDNLERVFGNWQNNGYYEDKGKILTDCCCVKEACKLLGFTPRKGSKQLVEIKVKKLAVAKNVKDDR